ncbi:hypothetical protein ACQP25_45290 (plasmid) [Microtetraspora malaysiensis]|uniref:hypothetical protein n=1 Tax=Microtetraspora malaysiensis TaxID=161358 RepID=UPI003D93FF85
MTPRKKITIAAAAAALTVIAGCSSSTYEERLAFLRKVANRGVDTYKLLYSQEARIDKARCERAFDGSGAADDAPPDSSGGRTPEWRGQVKEFFVDSCLSGKPKPVPGDLPYPASTPAISDSPSATPSPS